MKHEGCVRSRKVLAPMRSRRIMRAVRVRCASSPCPNDSPPRSTFVSPERRKARVRPRREGDDPIMYRPNFCAECGERVLRARWRVWTSRRFCASCGPRFRRRRIVAPLLLIASLSGTGFFLGRLGRPAPPPLIVERGALNLAPFPAGDATRQADATKRSDGGVTKTKSDYGPDGSPTERPTEPNEIISMCGARTKKGTPCQRRVRGTGRCWQHRGMTAMLPASKLIVPE